METNPHEFTRGAAGSAAWSVAWLPRALKVDEPAISGDTSWVEECMAKPPKKTKTFWLSEEAANELDDFVSDPEGDRSMAACAERLVRWEVENGGIPESLPPFDGKVRKVLSLAPDVVEAIDAAGPTCSQILEYLLNPKMTAPNKRSLRSMRLRKGLTQIEVAEQLGITVGVYKFIESGKRASVPQELEIKIKNLLGVMPSTSLSKPKPRLEMCGYAIRERRHAKGLTQAELAKEIGSAREVITALEREKRPLSEAMAKRLAAVFKCSWEGLFD